VIPNTVLVLNGKGGVLKTSAVANLAGVAVAGDSGWRVLVVDLDRQGNLARDLGYLARADDGQTLARGLIDGAPPEPIREVRRGMDALAGGPALDDVVADLQRSLLRGDLSAANRLGKALDPLAEEYDLVMMDSPPGEALLHAAAIRAAHYVLIPTQPDAASLDGIGQVADIVVREADYNPYLEVLGVVLGPIPGLSSWTQRDPANPRKQRQSAIARDARRELAAMLGDTIPVFTTAIRDAKKIAVDCRKRGDLAIEYEDAAANAKPWWKLRADGDTAAQTFSSAAANLAEDYRRLAEEVFGRFLERQAAYYDRIAAKQQA
jgi:cellulose biosynthesis protein BcsQ